MCHRPNPGFLCLISHQPTRHRPGVEVPGSGQLHDVPAEHSPPPAQHINLHPVEVLDRAGAVGEGGEEATLGIGEGDAPR